MEMAGEGRAPAVRRPPAPRRPCDRSVRTGSRGYALDRFRRFGPSPGARVRCRASPGRARTSVAGRGRMRGRRFVKPGITSTEARAVPAQGECGQGRVAVTQGRRGVRWHRVSEALRRDRRRSVEGSGNARGRRAVVFQPVENGGGDAAPGPIEVRARSELPERIVDLPDELGIAFAVPGAAACGLQVGNRLNRPSAHSPVRRARSVMARPRPGEWIVGSTPRIAAANGSVNDPSAAENAGPRSPKRAWT